MSDEEKLKLTIKRLKQIAIRSEKFYVATLSKAGMRSELEHIHSWCCSALANVEGSNFTFVTEN